jgi:uncharacterized protein YabE (DUF348 family)
MTISLLLILTGIGFYIFNKQQNPKVEPYIVIITENGQSEDVPSIEPTVGALLNKLNIKLGQGDIVEPSLNAHINQDKFRINIYKALPVEIVEGNQKTFTFSAAKTPRAIAEQAGINLYPEDLVTSSPANSFLNNYAIGQVVNIKQSVPINLILYGHTVPTRTHSNTVAEMLQEKHVILQPGDTVQPSLNSPISAGENIFILHKGTIVTTSTQTIAEPINYINDASLSTGTSAVTQAGSPGQLLITYEVNPKTGAKTQIQAVEVVTPVPEIVALGTAPVASSLSQWLYALRSCESGGNYQEDTGNGFYGAYQFLPSEWNRVASLTGNNNLVGILPSQATPAEQDMMIVLNTNLSSGGLATQNPGCYYRTGISAFPPTN